MPTRPPQRTTRSRLPTRTTVVTGTTPNPTMTPTPTRATMETLARPTLPLLTARTDTAQARTQHKATAQQWQRQAQPRSPATPRPRQQRRRLPTAATPSRHQRLWWSPQTLPPPLPTWCAATAPWASNRWWRPHTGNTHTPTPWARPLWSGWGRCQSWCLLRAERAHLFEIEFEELLAFKTRLNECSVAMFEIRRWEAD